MEVDVASSAPISQHTIRKEHVGTVTSVSISGGSFVQSAIMPQTEVKYDNTNAQFLVTSSGGKNKWKITF